MKFDLEYLEKLANIVYENDLSEITLEDDEKAVCLKREKQPVVQAVAPVVAPATVTSQVISPATKSAEIEKIEAEVAYKGIPIIAPMVGTFYSAPSPDAAPFVKVGDRIAKGQVVCIIEAMKLMNEIESEVSGEVTEICVNNGDPVEFAQVLMYVK